MELKCSCHWSIKIKYQSLNMFHITKLTWKSSIGHTVLWLIYCPLNGPLKHWAPNVNSNLTYSIHVLTQHILTTKLHILLSVLTQYLKKEKSASVFMPGKKDSYIRSSLSDNVHQWLYNSAQKSRLKEVAAAQKKKPR